MTTLEYLFFSMIILFWICIFSYAIISFVRSLITDINKKRYPVGAIHSSVSNVYKLKRDLNESDASWHVYSTKNRWKATGESDKTRK
jgi:hypothetical protein